MKGIARTQKEIEFHDRVAALGCISCRQEGIHNTWVSIHHAHGRTKPGCHMWVLPLCASHHVDDGTAVARHPTKRRWEEKYGNEDDLVRQVWAELGVEFTEPMRVAKPVNRDRPKKSTSRSVEVGVVTQRNIKANEGKSLPPKTKQSETKTRGITSVKKTNLNPASRFSAGSKLGSRKITSKLKSRGEAGTVLTETQKALKKQYSDKAKLYAAQRRLEFMKENEDAIAEKKRAAKLEAKRIRSEYRRKAIEK